MSAFTVYPSSTALSCARGKRQRARATETRIDLPSFVLTMLGLMLVLSYQSGDFHSDYDTNPSLFLGTKPVSAATAAALSVKAPRASRPTMVTMAAGSSRTLIELANQDPHEIGEVQFEVTYLDEDDEQGLLVLRRANVVDAVESRDTTSVTERGHAVYERAVQALKNPVILLVLAGNIASMSGVLPPGVAGFLPALGFFLRNKIKWAAPILGKLSSLKMGRAIVSKLKFKFGKLVSGLYKNRSKYSLLSDCLWYVDTDGKKNNKKQVNENKKSTTSTSHHAGPYRAVA